MDKIPDEIENHIIEYIFYNKCYLKDKNLKKCASISKKFSSNLKCQTFLINLNKEYIEYCLIHDIVLLKNINNIIKSLLNNFNDNFNYYVEIFVNNNSTILIPLSVFHLEPYIGVMNDNYYYHYLDIKLPKLAVIDEIKKRFVKRIFQILNLKYNDHILGYNSEKIKPYTLKLKFLQEKIEKLLC